MHVSVGNTFKHRVELLPLLAFIAKLDGIVALVKYAILTLKNGNPVWQVYTQCEVLSGSWDGSSDPDNLYLTLSHKQFVESQASIAKKVLNAFFGSFMHYKHSEWASYLLKSLVPHTPALSWHAQELKYTPVALIQRNAPLAHMKVDGFASDPLILDISSVI